VYGGRVSGCCNARGCDRLFNEKFARKMAKRYRKRGLDKTARKMVAFLEERGVEGATVLEVGGGVGEIQIELLERGASHSTNLELSPGYDEEALRLLGEHGLSGRADRRLHDIAVDPETVGAADVVVLHRVVCCYPDYERLLGAVAEHARRVVVFSYPPRNIGSRAFVVGANLLLRIMRREYRTFAHPPRAMLDVLERRGLHRTFERHSLTWQVAGLERA
jgi:2-polyprenyl-3-methyl-5-hydroxy-6-metoxy-1,4-benzoquinol methylase